MTCTEFQELAGLLAAGSLSGDELAQAEQHLAEPRHEGCFEALRRASAGVEVLARSLVPVRPDDRVWQNIAARLDGAAVPVRSAAPVWRERIAWLAVAASVALAVATLAARARDNRTWSARHAEALAAATRVDEQRNAAVLGSAHAEELRAACARELSGVREEAEAQRSALLLLQTPGTQVVSLAPPKGDGLSARAILNVGEKRGVLLASRLLAPAGHDYELWVIRGDKKVPAGLLRAAASGAVLASIDPQLFSTGRPDALAITLEPQGGVPQPTGPIVLVGALPKS